MSTHRGRPRRSNEAEIKRDILVALSIGTPLSVAARANNITRQCVHQWQSTDPEFSEDLAAARSLGWDALAHECLEIADDGTNDWMETRDHDGEPTGWRFNNEAVLRSKLRIETRMRLLRAWQSGTYAEPERALKVDAVVTETVRHVVDARVLDDAGRAALRALLAQAQAAGLIPPPDDADDDDAVDAVWTDGPLADRQPPDEGDV